MEKNKRKGNENNSVGNLINIEETTVAYISE